MVSSEGDATCSNDSRFCNEGYSQGTVIATDLSSPSQNKAAKLLGFLVTQEGRVDSGSHDVTLGCPVGHGSCAVVFSVERVETSEAVGIMGLVFRVWLKLQSCESKEPRNR